MSYISILVPAFYTKETEDSEIEYEFIKLPSEKNEYAIKFKQSDLSLSKIEDLVYQRDCTKSLVEKTFESLQSMTDKLVNLEKELRSSLNCKHEESNEGGISDSQKLKDLLTIQLENSENFRLNTERTLNRIKEEFQQMVLELDVLRKQTSNKHSKVKSMDFQEKKYQLNKRMPEGTSSTNFNNNSSSKKNVPKLKLNK